MSTLQDFSGTLVLVGAGKMGGAMLEGWLALGLDPKKIAILEPQPAPRSRRWQRSGVRINPPRRSTDAAFIILAVKPQVAADVVPPLKALMRPDTVAVSVMAGKTIAFLEGALGDSAPIVRSIPNTPAAIGRGITVAVAERKSDGAQRALAQRCCSQRRRGRMGRRRRPDRRRDRRVGLGPGLCVPARRKPCAGGRGCRACPPIWRRGLHARPSRVRASCCIARRSMPRPCGRT